MDKSSNMKRMSGKDDQRYGPFSFPNGFPLFGTTFTRFFIETNGIISMDSQSEINLKLFPLDADVDLRQKGSILHGEITDNDLLRSIASIVKKVCPTINFM